MSRPTIRFNVWPRVAFLAMAGMVWMVLGLGSVAKAASGSCCSQPMEADGCRCCAPAEPVCEMPPARDVPADAVVAPESSVAGTPCACRPASPAPRETLPAGSRTTEPRPTESLAGALLAPLAMLNPPTPSLRPEALSREPCPPGVPLFLRDARLRF